MIGARLSLLGLVEAARDRALGDADFSDENIATLLAEEVCRLCLGGQFRWAWKVSSLSDTHVPEEWRPYLGHLFANPQWVAFHEAVTLAERIDSFLATLERGALAPLARDCRDDLALLLVLGDCCQDSGLPHAAAEARQLHALVVSDLRGSAGDVSVADSAPDEDTDEWE